MILNTFLDSECIVEQSQKILSSHLYSYYLQFVFQNSQESPLSNKAFTQRIHSLLPDINLRHRNRGEMWIGLTHIKCYNPPTCLTYTQKVEQARLKSQIYQRQYYLKHKESKANQAQQRKLRDHELVVRCGFDNVEERSKSWRKYKLIHYEYLQRGVVDWGLSVEKTLQNREQFLRKYNVAPAFITDDSLQEDIYPQGQQLGIPILPKRKLEFSNQCYSDVSSPPRKIRLVIRGLSSQSITSLPEMSNQSEPHDSQQLSLISVPQSTNGSEVHSSPIIDISTAYEVSETTDSTKSQPPSSFQENAYQVNEGVCHKQTRENDVNQSIIHVGTNEFKKVDCISDARTIPLCQNKMKSEKTNQISGSRRLKGKKHGTFTEVPDNSNPGRADPFEARELSRMASSLGVHSSVDLFNKSPKAKKKSLNREEYLKQKIQYQKSLETHFKKYNQAQSQLTQDGLTETKSNKKIGSYAQEILKLIKNWGKILQPEPPISTLISSGLPNRHRRRHGENSTEVQKQVDNEYDAFVQWHSEEEDRLTLGYTDDTLYYFLQDHKWSHRCCERGIEKLQRRREEVERWYEISSGYCDGFSELD
jgi:hypothetical protein